MSLCMSPLSRRTLAAAALAVVVLLAATPGAAKLRIYHIDVDQGDATLFVSPGGHTMLVDCGKNGHGPRVKAVMDSAGVTTIDHFVCTHYHEDHYGGIDDLVEDLGVPVLNAYSRGDTAYLTTTKRQGATFAGYRSAVGGSAVHLMRGEAIPLDDEMAVTCVASGGVVLGEEVPEPASTENDASIALLVQYGGFRYFIGGDIQETTERKLAERDLVTDVDVYQADHHGSDTSSCSELLSDMAPTAIVISNGNRADYQHPRQVTLDRCAACSPCPIVLQTNKYLRGELGGNVPDAFIADLESTGTCGTILVTVDEDAWNCTATYADTSVVFPIKAPRAAVARLVIESVLPNPVGKDRDLEEITLRNCGETDCDMTGWVVRDRKGRVWTLNSMSVIGAGESRTIRRDGMPMNLNNNGDTVELVDAANHVWDEFDYSGCCEGVVIQTNH